MTTALTPSPPYAALPGSPLPAVFAGGPKAERRFWEFFATQLANDNTRRAYQNGLRCVVFAIIAQEPEWTRSNDPVGTFVRAEANGEAYALARDAGCQPSRTDIDDFVGRRPPTQAARQTGLDRSTVYREIQGRSKA
jgi:hypothetical protein